MSLFGGLSARHVRRPRLTRLLDASTAQAIVIVAPAGYGKTTLAAEWLEGRKRVAWYRATSAAADLAAYFEVTPGVAGTDLRGRGRFDGGGTVDRSQLSQRAQLSDYCRFFRAGA